MRVSSMLMQTTRVPAGHSDRTQAHHRRNTAARWAAAAASTERLVSPGPHRKFHADRNNHMKFFAVVPPWPMRSMRLRVASFCGNAVHLRSTAEVTNHAGTRNPLVC